MKSLFRLLKSFYRVIAGLLNFVLGYIVRFLAVIAVHLLFRPKVLYRNKKTQKNKLKRATVVIANHIYFIDGAILGTVFRRDRIFTLAAKDLYRKKILVWLLNRTRCIPLDRGAIETTWFTRSVDLLKKGYSLAMFPEGVSSYTGKMRTFKPGFVRVALEADVDILLVCIDGTYKPFRQRQWVLIDDSPIHLEIPEDGVKSEYIHRINDEMHQRMLDMQKELRALRYGEITVEQEN